MKAEQRAQFFENIVYRLDHLGAITQQLQAATATIMQGGPGQGENFAALFKRGARRDQRAATGRRLDYQHTEGKPTDNAIALREVFSPGWRTGRKLGNQTARLHQLRRQREMTPRIDCLNASGHHGHARAAGLQRTPMCGSVDTQRQPGAHPQAGR